MCHGWVLPTCALEVCTELQPLSDAALRVGRKGFLDILHANPPRSVSALPEETIYEDLASKSKGEPQFTHLTRGGVGGSMAGRDLHIAQESYIS